MKRTFVTLLIAAFVLPYSGTSQAQELKATGTWEVGPGGKLIAGVGNADCSTQLGSALALWASVDTLNVCLTATNLGKTNFIISLLDSSGIVAKQGEVPTLNTLPICAPEVSQAIIGSELEDCKAVWHIDQYDSLQ